jgi:pimeloyl-ACP methyl ester carboxylesterase
MSSKMLRFAAAAGCAAAGAAFAGYLKDIHSARTAIVGGSRMAVTAKGSTEYAEIGQGDPILVIHGAGGGYDQGLLIGRDLGPGFRIIAPSRFGYLRTPIPQDSSPAAQADAHAALLDHLDVTKCVVVGTSAGAPSAIELALRYPERVIALILLMPRTYDPTQAIGVDKAFQSRAVLRLVEGSADFLFWLATRVARPAVVRFLGVVPELERRATASDRARVTEVMEMILPLSLRVPGIDVDSRAEIREWPLERVRAPTLVVSAQDDLFKTLAGARYTAARIPGARLKVLPTGGHLMVGQGDQVRQWVAELLHGLSRSKGRPDRLRINTDANEHSGMSV